MRSLAKRLLSEESGAVAFVYALALPALIVIGGVAFDYARLASLDTELQNAADQAALAAATQLDQSTGSCVRASAAATTLVSNSTLFSKQAGTVPAISVTGVTDCVFTSGEKIRFWQDKDKTNPATGDADARFVEVTVDARQARYALTPIVGVFNTGAIDGTAMAGLGSAICKAPPVMICNPLEPIGNTDTNLDFDVASMIGKGLKLVSVGNGNTWKTGTGKGQADAEGTAPGVWAPGNFGYLNTGGGNNGAPGLQEALGWETAPGNCLGTTGVDTKPGASVSVTDALNTRFDIYDNGACQPGGSCPASINSVKDLLRAGNASGNNACRLQNAGWDEPSAGNRYLPTSATVPLATTSTPQAMGHPRDMCHAVTSSTSGYCSGPVGNGLWDRDAYFRVNYRRSNGTYWTSSDWQANTGLPSNATRYSVYAWEIANRDLTVDGVTILAPRIASGNGANAPRAYGKPICSAIEGFGSGTIPGGTAVDRRRISVAGVNCRAEGVNGSSTGVPVKKWIEVFLVEPSYKRDRTSAGDVYVEIIGETSTGAAGATAGQVVRRDKPYLVQ